MALLDITLPVSYSTKILPQSNKRVTVMKDNSFIIQKDSGGVHYRGTIVLIHLTPAMKTSLESFYTTNADIIWTFLNPHDGLTYSLNFVNVIEFTREEREATELYIATFEVIGTYP